MQRYRQRSRYVEAAQITDEMFDAQHSSDLHIPGVVYDPVVRIARLPNGVYGFVGYWIVRDEDGRLTVWGDTLFNRRYQKRGGTVVRFAWRS
ncbi:hypothetical protein LCGC14_1973400 [marine sediment metagenome]|uniref:Uncharacterized protein n=1 Tax=marine sediment metagenome TaxID=412755 RepID=A0A0F9I873_9ZZZZ